jgi:hypothetical protein
MRRSMRRVRTITADAATSSTRVGNWLLSVALVLGVNAQVVVVIDVVQGQHGLVHGRVDHPVRLGHTAWIGVIIIVAVGRSSAGIDGAGSVEYAASSVPGGAGGELPKELVLVVEPRRHPAARQIGEEPCARSGGPLSRHQHQQQQSEAVRLEAGQ